jgi:hypothetical protein
MISGPFGSLPDVPFEIGSQCWSSGHCAASVRNKMRNQDEERKPQ